MKIFKVIIVGPEKSGKSILFNTLKRDELNTLNIEYNSNLIHKYCPTIGVDFGSRILEFENFDVVKLQFWDTSGKERFDDITSIYYQKIDIVFLVFDIDSSNFNEMCISNWVTKIKNLSPKVPIFFIANKKSIPIIQENSLQNNYFVTSNFIYQKGVSKYFEIDALYFDDNIKNLLHSAIIYLVKFKIQNISSNDHNQLEENLLKSSDLSDKQSENKLDDLYKSLVDKPRKKRKFWNYFCSIC